MPRLAPQPRAKIIKAIERAYGFKLEREGGRHTIYAKQGVPEPIPIPRHKEISIGVIRSICRVLGVSVEEFLETLRHC